MAWTFAIYASKPRELTETVYCRVAAVCGIDGSTSMVAAPEDGTSQVLSVRADYVGAPTGHCLTASKLRGRPMHDDKRMVRPLLNNKRLRSAFFRIFWTRLDSEDMGQLLSGAQRIETVEADGALIYLAEQDGYHLHGATKSLRSALDRIPRQLAFNSSLSVYRFIPSTHSLHTMPLNSPARSRRQSATLLTRRARSATA